MLSGYAGVTYEMAGEYNAPLPPTANEDPGNGLLGAVAILLALLHRDATGEGQAMENPQLNATMTHLAHIVRTPAGDVIGSGKLDVLQTGRSAFDRLYETADGWVCIVARAREERAALLAVLGADATTDDDAQTDRLRGAIASRKTAELLDELRAAGVPSVEPVGRNVHAFMNDPEQRRVGRVAEVAHPTLGGVRELDVLLRVSATTRLPHRLAPGLGEHTDEILAELGCTAAEIAALRDAGAVR
jgi:crotonobetainyl-CoA:carnitine CoA-transferase CaiB-like acyl-CoA transferase